jgi:hypothetical protein
MTADVTSRPRGAMRPSRARITRPENRGRGECRVPVAPAASCAVWWWHTSVATTGPPGSPGIPARNGFTAYAVLSPATNSFLSPSSADMACLSPVGPTRLRKFSTSNGCQDHTVLPSATIVVRLRAVGSLTSDRTRPAIPFAPDAAASTASHPNVRDDHDTPLVGDGMAGDMRVIWVRREGKYFCKQDWTASIRLIRFNKSRCTRSPPPTTEYAAPFPSGCSALQCLARERFAKSPFCDPANVHQWASLPPFAARTGRSPKACFWPQMGRVATSATW